MGQAWGLREPPPPPRRRSDAGTRAAEAIRREPPVPEGDTTDPLRLAIPGLRDTRRFRATQMERSGDALNKSDLVALLCRLVPHDGEIYRAYERMTCDELRRAIRLRLYAPAAAACPPPAGPPPADPPPYRAPLHQK